MAKVKLDLKSKTDAEIIELAQQHIAAMTGNANFPTPMPDAAGFLALTTTAADALAAADAAHTAWRTAVATKDAAILELSSAGLNARASYVDSASGGDEAKILSSGFNTRAPATPIGLPAQPGNLIAAMGSLEGTMELDWETVRGAVSYIVECKLHSDSEQWQQVKIVTRSDATLTGLVSGSTYAFRVRAVGAAGEGPWSDEAVKMAP